MSIVVKKELYLGGVQIVNFLEQLDTIESKVSLLKKTILINENPSCGLEVLNSPAKEINASLDRGKVSQIHFLNYSKEIFDEYKNLIKTVNPFISDDIQGASTCNELLERISRVKAKIQLFIFYKGSPFVHGLSTEILTKILNYLPLTEVASVNYRPVNEVASVCKRWYHCSLGVWTRHWLEILEDKDTPLEMKEGMKALQRLFPKDSGLALISKFFRFFALDRNAARFNRLGHVNFSDYINYNEICKLSRSQLTEQMIRLFNGHKDYDLSLLWGIVLDKLCCEPEHYLRLLNVSEIRNWMKLKDNKALLETITSIDLCATKKETGVIFESMRTIPPEIIYLTNLIEVRANASSAPFVPGIYLIYLPPELCELAHLKNLELCGNALTELPNDIGKLKKLEKIYISRNRLIHLPKSISQISSLQLLEVGDNRFNVRNLKKIIRARVCNKVEDNRIKVRTYRSEFSKFMKHHAHRGFEKLPRTLRLEKLHIVRLFGSENWQKVQAESEFIPKSLLGELYHFILFSDVLEEEHLRPLVSAFSKSDQKLIFKMIWVCAGRRETDDPHCWGKQNCFNFKEIGEDVFVAAIHEMIIEKYHRLSQQQKNAVERHISILAGMPNPQDTEWGNKHALEILARLADAMELALMEEDFGLNSMNLAQI